MYKKRNVEQRVVKHDSSINLEHIQMHCAQFPLQLQKFPMTLLVPIIFNNIIMQINETMNILTEFGISLEIF